MYVQKYIDASIYCTYSKHMDITFDPDKDRLNIKDHDGISLADAAQIDWDTAVEELDTREDYGEDRYRAFGFIGNRLHCVVYVDRDEGRRIISLRKATAREVKDYVEANL